MELSSKQQVFILLVSIILVFTLFTAGLVLLDMDDFDNLTNETEGNQTVLDEYVEESEGFFENIVEVYEAAWDAMFWFL